MGQKVSPVGLRVGINRGWDGAWYAEKTKVADLLLEDIRIRKYLEKKFYKDLVSRISIERFKMADQKQRVKIGLYTAKPGAVCGREGELKNKTIKELKYMTKKEISLNVYEIKHPELDAKVVARLMADQLEARASFRRVQKIAIQKALRAGAKGVKTSISGRLAGAEMARSEGYLEGRVPLHTLRADIDYATAEALTTYGILGVKVWIYKGEILDKKLKKQIQIGKPEQNNKNSADKNDENTNFEEKVTYETNVVRKKLVKGNTDSSKEGSKGGK